MFVTKAWNWFFSIQEGGRPPKDAVQKLDLNLRCTAKCRFRASKRLYWQGRFAFLTTTLLSLGLIFVPLVQMTEINLAFKPRVLSMMQIFLAVAVLVHSVVIGTARYDVRAEKLNECGDRLKSLARSLSRESDYLSPMPKDILESFQEKYTLIVKDAESHEGVDYMLVKLEMRHDYHITGGARLFMWFSTFPFRLVPYSIPLTMLLVELILITDMLGFSEVWVSCLRGVPLTAKYLLQ